MQFEIRAEKLGQEYVDKFANAVTTCTALQRQYDFSRGKAKGFDSVKIRWRIADEIQNAIADFIPDTVFSDFDALSTDTKSGCPVWKVLMLAVADAFRSPLPADCFNSLKTR